MRKWRKKWFRKIVSVFVSAVLVAGMVFAEMEAEVCAAEGEHTHNGITYEAWTRTDSLPTAPGNYYLTEDVTLLKKWDVPIGTTKLCLNGKTIERTEATHSGDAGDGVVIHIPISSKLYLYDCLDGGKITGATSYGVDNEGEFYMYSGKISGNSWGGVDNRRAVFHMYGGKISDNTSSGTGIVENDFGSTFCMYGGEISSNTSEMIGGVANDSGAIFYMYGGKIAGNIVKYPYVGGVENGGIFYMYGGEICDNMVGKNYNGGVGGVLSHGDAFYMYGGKIINNIGRGVNYSNKGKVIVGGSVVISGNRMQNGNETNVWFLGDNLKDEYKIIIDSDNPLSDGAKIGITIGNNKPTAGNPIRITGANGEDYSSYFYSDDENYVISDSIDHKVWLTENGEHTHVVESWSSDADRHWRQCFLCGEKYDEAAHTFGEWLTDREATETEDGEKHRDCGVCGFQERETIPAMKPTVPPTKVPTSLPTEKPGVTPEPVATEKPGVTPEPVVTEKPGATSKPVVTEKPGATLKPVATEKPGSTPKPVVTEKPDSTPKPAATEKPGATLKPVTTEKPSTSPKPAATKRPTATPELVATEQPGETQKPPATEQPGVPSEPPVTKQPSAAPNPVVTLKPEETKQPPATKHPMVTEKPASTVRPGRIRLKVEVKGNAPGTRVSTSAEQVADMILTAEDWKKLEDGQDINMYVVVTDISNRVSDADRVLAEAASAGYVSGQYVDISLYKEVGSERTRITGPLAGNISLTIVVPDRLKNTESTKKREFAVTRVHNGEAAILLDQDSGADTVTVDTDCFSTYGIVYKDTENKTGSGRETGGSRTGSKAGGDKQNDSAGTGRSGDGEPKTGDGTAFEPAATIAMISGLSYVLLYFWERRRGMTEETKKQITTRIIRWARKGGCLRKGIAIAVIFVFLVYYHSIGKETNEEWKHAI